MTRFVAIANPISGRRRCRRGPTKVALPLALGTPRPARARTPSAGRRPVLVHARRLAASPGDAGSYDGSGHHLRDAAGTRHVARVRANTQQPSLRRDDAGPTTYWLHGMDRPSSADRPRRGRAGGVWGRQLGHVGAGAPGEWLLGTAARPAAQRARGRARSRATSPGLGSWARESAWRRSAGRDDGNVPSPGDDAGAARRLTAGHGTIAAVLVVGPLGYFSRRARAPAASRSTSSCGP